MRISDWSSDVCSPISIEALSALAQEHRLALFRLLVQAGQRGMAAGAIAEALGIPNSSLSFHLAQLRGAKLIEQERQHRTIIYRANYPAMTAPMAYLLENCCAASGCESEAACAGGIHAEREKIGRATCRERVCQYV